jgi:hypothetical protein
MVRVKKYFYVLRPILACDWIKQTNTMAPMEFEKLLNTQVTDPAVKKDIETLLDRKKAGDELKVEPKIPRLNDFLESRIGFYKEYVKEKNITTKPDNKELNHLFRDTLTEVWKS